MQFWAYYSRILNKLSDFFFKKFIFHIFGWFVREHNFFCHPDPDQRFLKWTRIPIRNTASERRKRNGENIRRIELEPFPSLPPFPFFKFPSQYLYSFDKNCYLKIILFREDNFFLVVGPWTPESLSNKLSFSSNEKIEEEYMDQ